MSEADARAIALWRYEPPYDFYDGSESEVAVMVDPINQYRSIWVAGELVGYVCVGPDARVAGQRPEAEIDDVGYGFRPDLTGRRLASGWLPALFELLDGMLLAPTQRVIIAAWNERSQVVAQRLGFGDAVKFENRHGDWVVLTRAVRRATG